jgi:hypothetical protein
MNTLPHLIASLPDCYQDGSFQVLMRNADSVAVFWDLPDGNPSFAAAARLCLHSVPVLDSGEILEQAREVLILQHEAGHALVPLAGGNKRYRFILGWDDGSEFCRIATDEVEMPGAGTVAGRRGMGKAVEGKGFRPLALAN